MGSSQSQYHYCTPDQMRVKTGLVNSIVLCKKENKYNSITLLMILDKFDEGIFTTIK